MTKVESWPTFNKKRGAFANRKRSRDSVLVGRGFVCIWPLQQMPVDDESNRKKYVKDLFSGEIKDGKYLHIVYYSYLGRCSNVEIEVWGKPKWDT